MPTAKVMHGVREYAEGYPVELVVAENGRFVILAWNQAKHDCTQIDLEDLLEWLRKNHYA